MKLSEIYTALANSELTNLSLVDNGCILPERQNVVINAINLGLIRLYTRFLIRKDFENIELVENQTDYQLTSGDILEILKLYDLDLNEFVVTGEQGITRLANTKLRVSKEVPRGTYSVEYIVLPTTIPEDTTPEVFDASQVEVDLPHEYLTALLYFVGSRMHSPVGIGADNLRQNRLFDVSYIERYEIECRMLETRGTALEEFVSESPFYSRGFV